MKIKNLLFLTPLVLVAVLLFVVSSKDTELVHGSTINQGPYLQSATTSTAIAVTSSTRLLATTTNPLDPTNSYNRIYATICNPSTTLVYVLMDADKPASNAKANVVIAAAAGYNACFEINDRNPYSGSITASSTNETSTSILVTSYVSK